MEQSTVAPLTNWANFYVIIGSSAGALTGLQFVVITLVAEPLVGGSEGDIRAFGTPTVVHFCAALLISAIMTAPWHTLAHTALCIGLCGLPGLAYALRVVWHARNAAYSPDTEDWFWYVAVPLVAYGAVIAAAVVFWWHATLFLFVIAVAALLFLFDGIHNAWDAVTYIAIQRRRAKSKAQN